MNANTQAAAPAPKAAPNTGILAMRAANACRALGLAPRDGWPTPAPKAAAVKAPARRESPAPAAPVEDEGALRAFRVVVLVGDADTQTHVRADVNAAGPRRAGKQARAQALAAGHTPVGICATLTDECPTSLWKALDAIPAV